MTTASTVTPAQQLFQQWKDSTPADPLRFMAIIAMLLGDEESNSLQIQATQMQVATKNIAAVNDELKGANTAASVLSANSNETRAAIAKGLDEFSASALRDKLVADTGMSASDFPVQADTLNPSSFEVYVTKDAATTAAKNLQLRIDSLSGDNQESGLFVQTLTGRITNIVDLVSALYKRLSDQAGTVSDNTRHQ